MENCRTRSRQLEHDFQPPRSDKCPDRSSQFGRRATFTPCVLLIKLDPKWKACVDEKEDSEALVLFYSFIFFFLAFFDMGAFDVSESGTFSTMGCAPTTA